MLDSLAVWCTSQLIDKNVVEEKKYDIYVYGFQLFYSTLFSVLTMLTVSCITHNLLQGIIFLVIFMSLRMTANGYHAKTYFRCFLLTNSIFITYLLLFRQFEGTPLKGWMAALTLLSGCYIWWNAPVEHPNHRLSEKKKIKNRNNARKLLISILIFLIVFYILKWYDLIISIDITILFVAIMMIVRNKKGD